MAEIIGTAASVIQVAEAGFSLATTLYNYSKSVKSAEKDIKKIARDVKLTAKVLQRTHEQLKADVLGKSCTHEAIHDLEEVLDGCREAFQEVDDALMKSMRPGANGKFTMSMTEKLKWPLRSSKLEVLRANLEKLKSTLLLMLSVLAYGAKASQAAVAASMKVQVELTLDKLQVESLIEAKNGAEERYEELRRKFEELEMKAGANARETDDIEATAEGASANIAVALPGADAPHNEMDPTEITNPSDSLATALQRCATTVSFLAICIDSSAEKWRTTRSFHPQSINFNLHEAVEAIRELNDEAASQTNKLHKSRELRSKPRHPAQSRETSQRNRETDSHLSETCRAQSHELRRIPFDTRLARPAQDPALTEWHTQPFNPAIWTSPKENLDYPDFSPQPSRTPREPFDLLTTTYEAHTRPLTSHISPVRESELVDLGNQFSAPLVKEEWANDTGVEEELLADDDGLDLDLGAEEELEPVECEEEEAEEEQEEGEEDLEPEDAVEQLLQRWTGLVGV
ncbi:hypothetical protein CB0940_11451 [Cercospora beticola]|uniref:Azaphilone pigments biosynthesis cluster protein L N-terminal domain-containing protein n=1 Tax=Cercospora beticola TaxID=122368 RepID=A0A2G5HEE8_CERBT|nr:hypothetical protein CB0940_11451 [Cercospora beticola]PIA90899.1 hypothetical protein CB0940_11451 [Cercospora beticola]WPB08306.1 hypothetical protein RHO25_012972 [Cercospora beticola]CAK1367811.1 unnamed protein product [Cercospora beticola]